MHRIVIQYYLDFALLAALVSGAAVAGHLWMRRSRHARRPPWSAWSAAAGVLVLGLWLAWLAGEAERSRLRGMLEGFASTYAGECERLGHAGITTHTPPDDPAYLALLSAQSRWLQANPAAGDIYTFRRSSEGGHILIVDSETDYDHNGRIEGPREARTWIGELCPELGSGGEIVLAGQPFFDDRPQSDRWGTWISAYWPLRDASGRVEAAVGVDYPAEVWCRSIAMHRAGVLGFVGVIEILMLGSSVVVGLLRGEIRERERSQRRLAVYRRRLERQVRQRSEQLLEAQRQVMQSEKLASLGQLAAGVAHEINTPIQYVGDNLRAVCDYLRDLTALTDQYRELVHLVGEGRPPGDLVERIAESEKVCDLDYIREDAPKAVSQGLDGVQRVAHIVRAMKDFSHVDRSDACLVDINRSLESTLTVARNEYKYVSDVQTDFGELPSIEGYGSELNQVFLNLLVNAAHAIADTRQRGVIGIRTRRDGDEAVIAISDTGTGIPTEIRNKIFDPFFTTKPVGKGTGQGLNIAHQIVVKKHGGSLSFQSEVGKGTTFTIRLPLALARAADQATDAQVTAVAAQAVETPVGS